MPRVPVRAVVFDLFVTLTDFDAERRRPELEADLAGALGVDPVAFRSLMRETFEERVTGGLGDTRSTLSALALRLGRGLAPEALDEVVELRQAHQRHLLTPRAGAVEVLHGIRDAGYAVGVLTDCTSEVVDLWPSLPYAAAVDAVTFSCRLGRRKPDPAGYRDIARRLGVAPEECLYVGDGGGSELTGAARAGMTPVLLETPFGADVRYDAETHWSGPTVEELSELRHLLVDAQTW